MSVRQHVDFYFDFISPWAYFAWLQMKSLKEEGVSLKLQPVPYPQLAVLWEARAVATIPPKRQFILKFAQRYGIRNGIPIKTPKVHPYKPYTSLRLAMHEVAGDQQEQIIDLLFRACWVGQVDMGLDSELETFLSENGFDGRKLLARTKDDEIKELLGKQTKAAIERGVFGVPTMFVEEELFWGSDQIEDIKAYLAGKDPLSEEERKLPPHSWGLESKRVQKSRITGIAHIVLNVSDFETSRSFYDSLCTLLGMKKVHESDKGFYYVGGKTALAIGESKGSKERFIQDSVGLHHLCFRARSNQEVDECYQHLKEQGVRFIHPPEGGPWAPGYYSILFEDPDGIRIEINHVPGQGLFKKGVKFNPVGYE